MNPLERLAAWVWDHCPGGVKAQNVVFDHAPQVADFLEELAWRRDEEAAT